MIQATFAAIFALLGSNFLVEADSKVIKLNNISSEQVVELMKERRVPVPDKIAYRSIDKATLRLSGAEGDIQKVEDAIKALDKDRRQVIFKFVFGEEGVPQKPMVYATPICRALEYQDVYLKFDPAVRDAQFLVEIRCYAFPNPDGTSSIRAKIKVGEHQLVAYLDKEDLITFGGKGYPKGYRITNKNKLKKEIEAQHPLGNLSGLTIGFWPTIIKPDDFEPE